MWRLLWLAGRIVVHRQAMQTIVGCQYDGCGCGGCGRWRHIADHIRIVGGVVSHVFHIGMATLTDGVRAFIVQVLMVMVAGGDHNRDRLRTVTTATVLAEATTAFHIRANANFCFQTGTALLAIRYCGRCRLIAVKRLLEHGICFRIGLFGRVNALVGSAVVLLNHVVLAGAKLKQIGRRVFRLFRHFDFFFFGRRCCIHQEYTAKNLSKVRGEIGLQLIGHAGNAHEQAMQKDFGVSGNLVNMIIY